MKKLAVLSSLLLTLEAVVVPMPAGAAAVNYIPKDPSGAGTFEGQAGVTQIGDLKLVGGNAVVKNNVIDIETVDPASNVKKVALSGVVLKTKVSGTGKQAKMTGYAYFRQGPSLNAIDDPETEELIDIEDGGVVTGKLVSVNTQEVVMSTKTGERRIALAAIKHLCSPRIFTFVMPVVASEKVDLAQGFQGKADKINFKRTAKPCKDQGSRSKATTAARERPRLCCFEPPAAGGTANVGKIVVIAGIMAAVAAAIAIPVAVAVPLANKKKSPPPVFFPPPPREQPPPPPPPPQQQPPPPPPPID